MTAFTVIKCTLSFGLFGPTNGKVHVEPSAGQSEALCPGGTLPFQQPFHQPFSNNSATMLLMLVLQQGGHIHAYLHSVSQAPDQLCQLFIVPLETAAVSCQLLTLGKKGLHLE